MLPLPLTSRIVISSTTLGEATMDDVIRVFLADENIAMRDALRALIATAPDMAVIGDTTSSTDLMEKAGILQPDVIILDLLLLGNEDVAPIISRIGSLCQARILILTNEMNVRETTAAINAGVTGYLLKGTAAQSILQSIRALYRGESIFDPAITGDTL